MAQEAWSHLYTFPVKVPSRFVHICFFSTPWRPPPANNRSRTPTFWYSTGTVGFRGHTTLNDTLSALWGADAFYYTFSSWVESKVIMCLSVIPKSSFIKITWTSYTKRCFKNCFPSLTPEESVVAKSSHGDSKNDQFKESVACVLVRRREKGHRK